MTRVRARTALIGLVLLLAIFFIARKLGEEDGPAQGSDGEVGEVGEVGDDHPEDAPPDDGERRALTPGWPEDKPKSDAEELRPNPETAGDRGSEEADPPETERAEGASDGEHVALVGDERFGEGRIEGRVTFQGTIPEPELLDMSKDPTCVTLASGIEQRTAHQIQVDDKGGLANAVVWVELEAEPAYSPPDQPIELHQKACRFRPETIAIQIGQTLRIFNDDPTLHNVHGFVREVEFNQAMPKQGTRIEKKFETKDIEGRLACEVHPWMKGRIYVLTNPFFAVTDRDGKFVIERLPGEGPYRLFVQHPHAGAKELAVESGTVEVVLSH